VILIDANIFMYAAGRESPQRLPCQRFLEKTVAGEGPAACTDAEVLQEILHRYRSLQVPRIGFQLFDAVIQLGIPILAVTDRALQMARTLLEDHPHLSTRDGVHLGVMREHGIEEVLSYDRGLSQVSWVKRLEA
jgi:predicted nucleic acid-binding protein